MEYVCRDDPKTEKLMYGYGINDVWYRTEIREEFGTRGVDRSSKLIFFCYIHNSWKLMLRRVFKDKGYERCRIQKDWLRFSNYYEWFIHNVPTADQDYVVDKDLASQGVPTYSESTCLFVPKKVNNLIAKSPKKSSDSLRGTYLDKSKKTPCWQGYYTMDGKRNIVGFSSEYSAHCHWRTGSMGNIKSEIENIQKGLYGNLSPVVTVQLYRILEDMSYTIIKDIPFKGFNLDYKEYYPQGD